MERSVVLEVVKHQPPAAAEVRPDGFWDLAFNLDEVFHHGYVEVHGREPAPGTNPFLDEYANLLAPDTTQLKWDPPGIALGDHLTGESAKLGRIFARAYLSMHGYRWFADVKALSRAPERGWSVRRPAAGCMPDWLIGDDRSAAVAEAKGTHSAIHAGSTALGKSWRPQLANIEARYEGRVVQGLKGWIVATRWVTSDKKRTLPKLYAEDPEVPGHLELDHPRRRSLLLWLARVHTVRNLIRLGRYRVAQRVSAAAEYRRSLPVAQTQTWYCDAPGLHGVRFIGRSTGRRSTDEYLRALLLTLTPIMRVLGPWDHWEEVRSMLKDWSEQDRDDAWFDGVALGIVKPLRDDEVPPPLEQLEVAMVPRPFVSLLPDGSLRCPMSLMRQAPLAEI